MKIENSKGPLLALCLAFLGISWHYLGYILDMRVRFPAQTESQTGQLEPERRTESKRSPNWPIRAQKGGLKATESSRPRWPKMGQDRHQKCQEKCQERSKIEKATSWHFSWHLFCLSWPILALYWLHLGHERQVSSTR